MRKRTFDGKIFSEWLKYKTKKEANDRARHERNRGDELVRVVKEGNMYRLWRASK